MKAVPFIKWVGGKTQLLPELLARLPASIDTYYEPFLGGGALFFALASEHPRRFKHAILSDINEELVTTYKALRDAPEDVIRRLDDYAKKHGEDFYYAVRADARQNSPAGVAARFIYLNKTGFNGLYRVNRRGEFNVPWGKHAKFTPDVEGLRAASRALQGTRIWAVPYDIACAPAKRGDVVYCDPPYVPVSETADFTSYTKDGFSWDNQVELRAYADAMRSCGVCALLSNADTPAVRRLYRGGGLYIEAVSARRSINSKGEKRGKVGEVIISTWRTT